MTAARNKAKSSSNAKPKAQTPIVDKSRNLHLKVVAGKSQDRVLADLVTDGDATNASTALRFVSHEFTDMSLTDMVESLRDSGGAINRGDLAASERMLNAQAVALNAIFAEMARIAHANLFSRPDTADRYLRLGLKAQSQCRTTVETLSAIKNPPVVFARQANIAHGPQQVNNGPAENRQEPPPRNINAHGETASAPTELLEDLTNGRTPMDTRATPATGRAHHELAAVGQIHRPTHSRG